jgi:hypothetical protein
VTSDEHEEVYNETKMVMPHLIKLSYCQPSSQPPWVGKNGNLSSLNPKIDNVSKWNQHTRVHFQPKLVTPPSSDAYPPQISSIHNTWYNYCFCFHTGYPTKSFIQKCSVSSSDSNQRMDGSITNLIWIFRIPTPSNLFISHLIPAFFAFF